MNHSNDRERFVTAGFSDKKLIRLARRPFWEKGLAPWHAWESERTGFGLGLRVGGFYPPFLPLFIKTDHYANPITEIRKNEAIGNQSGVYLTWNPVKAKKMRDSGYSSFCAKHPWRYLRLPQFSRETGKGTLLFLPHSHGKLRSSFDWVKIKSELKRIPKSALPITICIGEQDIHKGLLREVREHLDLPIVTAGELTSQLFPFRLWGLLRRHAYTAGFNLASHSIYAIWSGRPFLLLDERSFDYEILDELDGWSNYSSEEIIRRSYSEIIDEFEIWRESLRHFQEEPSKVQVQYVANFTDSTEALSRLELSRVLWMQLFRSLKGQFLEK